MFGWLRRRADREHCKLVYQNFDAASDGELKMYMLFQGQDPVSLDAMLLIANEQRARLREGKRLSNDDVERALKINKDLRRLYDHNHRSGRGYFDEVYAPLGGWSSYFERNGTVP